MNPESVFEYIPIERQIEKILDDISVQISENNEQFSEYIKKLLEIMEYDVPYTSKALMEKLGLKSKEGFRRNYLRPAIDMIWPFG